MVFRKQRQSERLLVLLDRAEPRVRRRFLELINAQRGLRNLEDIADLIESGRITEALSDFDAVADGLVPDLERAFTSAGQSAAGLLRANRPTLLEFNQLNVRAVGSLQTTRAALLVNLTQDQRLTTLETLVDGQRRGLAPIVQARELRRSLGLTQVQQRQIQNYRAVLESQQASQISQALNRQLRDRRFDGSVRRAVRGERALTASQIDRMVDRYAERQLDKRARDVARTESLAAIHAGDEELWQQAFDAGVAQPEDLRNVWRIDGAGVRDSHRAMEGQEQPFGAPFISGLGNRLRFPGDPQAPPADSINCRCVISRTLARV